jgi:hypothetical protein
MTIKVLVTNEEQAGGKSIRVHKVHFGEDGIHAEDGIIIIPGASAGFTIWHNCRLAVEEEYQIEITGTAPEFKIEE